MLLPQIRLLGTVVLCLCWVTFADCIKCQHPAKLLGIFSPSVGKTGFEMIHVRHQEPWKSLRP